jgi:hypothetical protein
MVRSSALCRFVVAGAITWPVAVGSLHVAFAAGSTTAASDAAKPAAAAASSAPPAAATVPTDAIKLVEDGARWENGYGEKFFQIVGTVTNGGAAPVGAVRIRVELLDDAGKVVATFDGWNARAEALGDLDGDAARAELVELSPGPIGPGESDRFRSTFLADETPKFASHRMRVVTVLPPA